MAASATMQSILTRPALCLSGRAALRPSLPQSPSLVRGLRRDVYMGVVKCWAWHGLQKFLTCQVNEGIKEASSTPKIIDLLEFNSPAPERINGRLAMLGFVSAIRAKLLSGKDVFSQISNGGFQLFLGASILFSIASFAPIFKGVDMESMSEGLMTAEAELLNGRLTRLGLVTLAVTEFAKGGALV